MGVPVKNTILQYAAIITPRECRRITYLDETIEELLQQLASLRGERQAMRNALWTRAAYARKKSG